ncbi:GNAT family N-acetyltransferase [Methylovirgula sp. HY1]|uniref:GNAT family N-acetyltransferase n=1 Tax=Methylovirgula sp. HY1 TaxID=2822761 RepID=UPI002103BA03|nr:GNAT family N-acyltransferase [Methylovirgula sp. HY1]
MRDEPGLPHVLGRSGDLEIRLATTKKEIRRAQRLRFKVFYEEGGAIAQGRAALVRRDICRFDKYCDHLLVFDMAARNSFGRGKPKVVGTYRLLRREIAERHGGFYSQNEFDIAPLLGRHSDKNFLELGRSCVHAKYRSKRVIELLWRGLWTYAKHYHVDVLIGCASLPGVNPLKLALPLSFLHHQASADAEWQVVPLHGRAVPMAILEKTAVDARKGVAALPPLVKAYLRVGAKFGNGAVVDTQFGTVDVFTIMPLAEIEDRYIAYFGSPDDVKDRAAA